MKDMMKVLVTANNSTDFLLIQGTYVTIIINKCSYRNRQVTYYYFISICRDEEIIELLQRCWFHVTD